MGLLEIMVLVLSIGYIIFLIIEKQYHEKIRKSFKHVILVNGIRGKSTTTRLVDSGLRNCGFRVFSKTTGTIPMMINCNNEQIPVKRWGLANIREQYRTMRKAYKDKAEILVIECMAVNPELQYVNQHHMLHADITLITNVRMDHIGDMGYNLEELADALGNTIPDEGTLIINDSKFIIDKGSKDPKTNIHMATYEENGIQTQIPYILYTDTTILGYKTTNAYLSSKISPMVEEGVLTTFDIAEKTNAVNLFGEHRSKLDVNSDSVTINNQPIYTDKYCKTKYEKVESNEAILDKGTDISVGDYIVSYYYPGILTDENGEDVYPNRESAYS